jgi:protein-disulfide isomerase
MMRIFQAYALCLGMLLIVIPHGLAQGPPECEDGKPCTDAVRLQTVPKKRVATSVNQMKELEHNPGSTPALKQVNVRALKRHPSIKGVPGISPGAGPDSAKVKVYVFSDFQCPVCRRVVEPVKLVARDNPKDVQVIFIQNALVMHPRAGRAAAASMAAAKQKKFWEFHDRIFQNQRQLSDADLIGHAKALRLNIDRFKRDMESKATLAQIEYERDLSQKLGVRGTPGFYVNGRKMVGWGSYNGFKNVVLRALKSAQALPTPKRGSSVAAEATKANGEDGKKFAELVWGL